MAVVVTTNKIKLPYIWIDCILYLNMNAYIQIYRSFTIFIYAYLKCKNGKEN